MKTTATLIQQALEQKAIDSMIAYALKSNQLNDLDRIAFKYIKNDY